MNKLRFDRTDYSDCCEEQGTASGLLEVGDLSCREIKPNKAIISIFSHHGDSQSGRKRSAQAAIGQAPCKPSRLSGLSPRNVRVESASIHLNEPTLVGATGRSLPCPNPDVALLGYSSAKLGRGAEIEVSSAPKSRIAELHMGPGRARRDRRSRGTRAVSIRCCAAGPEPYRQPGASCQPPGSLSTSDSKFPRDPFAATSSAMLSSPRRPSRTIRIFSSAE